MAIEIKLAYDKVDDLRLLFTEYKDLLITGEPDFGASLNLQNFDTELDRLEEKYGMPDGRLYVVYVDGEPAGCVAFHRFDEYRCEGKRLYVRPIFRGRHLSSLLMDRIIDDMRSLGYQSMLLDTLPFMHEAQGLYDRYDFHKIPPYYDTPITSTIFMEKNLWPYKKTCQQFMDDLASAAPTPGGGGAAALVGAVGVSLGAMVGNLTVGKKKYAAVQADIIALLEQSRRLSRELMALIDGDAEGFLLLAAAYKLPKDQPDRAAIMEQALRGACKVPLAIMEKSLEGMRIQGELVEKGSVLAVSDAGAAVQFLRAALLGASLNIDINTKSMRDRTEADRLTKAARDMERQGCALADDIYEKARASCK